MKAVHSKANSIETAVNTDLVELGKNIQKQREFLEPGIGHWLEWECDLSL